jgi:hypothetical protein
MSDAKIKRIAKLIAQDLFMPGHGKIKAHTLKLFVGNEAHEVYMGGWCEEAVRDRIVNILKSELADSD